MFMDWKFRSVYLRKIVSEYEYLNFYRNAISRTWSELIRIEPIRSDSTRSEPNRPDLTRFDLSSFRLVLNNRIYISDWIKFFLFTYKWFKYSNIVIIILISWNCTRIWNRYYIYKDYCIAIILNKFYFWI